MITEYCPHCEKEVQIKAGFMGQSCPNCNKRILPCSLCDHNEVDCNKCLANRGKIKNET